MTTKTTDDKPAAVGNIFQRIPAIMRDLPALPKGGTNVQQGYKFRGIDSVYNMIHPIMARHGVFMTSQIKGEKTIERPSKSGGVLITRSAVIAYTFWADDGSSVSTEVLSEAMDSGDKASNKAMSGGQKYAILQTLMVPTEDPKDSELDDPEPAPLPAAPERESGDDFLDEPAPPSPFDQLPDFAKAKKALGNAAYYEILGQIGVEHANEIAVEERAAVLKTMRAAFLVTKPKAKATK